MTMELSYQAYQQTVEDQIETILTWLAATKQGQTVPPLAAKSSIPCLNHLMLALTEWVGGRAKLAVDLELSQHEFDETWQPLIEQALELHHPVYQTEPTHSQLALPLSYGGDIIGLLGFERSGDRPWSEEELVAAETITEQLGLALENQRLFDQTQAILRETQTLYDLAIKLNMAATLDDILQTIIDPFIAAGADAARMFTYQLDNQGKPVRDECVAVWDKDGIPKIKVGTQVDLTRMPFLSLFFREGSEPTLISEVATDSRLDKEFQQLLLAANTHALAILPLTLAGRWVGAISINWPQPYPFSMSEIRFYKTLMLQVVIVVNNRLLFEQAQERAAQLEIIARIEVALSQAAHEDEILLALLPCVEHNLPELITLEYLQMDDIGALQRVAMWQNGSIQTQSTQLNQLVPVRQALFTHWLETPDELILIDDLTQETRLSNSEKQRALALGFRSVATLPLLSGARCQGVVSFIWSEHHDFTAREQFIFRRLMESLGAAVASRRAYVAAEAARLETERLYQASRRINEARDLLQMVTAIGQTQTIPTINRVMLLTFQRDSFDEVQSVLITAVWHSGQGTPPIPIGTYYLRESFPLISQLLTAQPVFLGDTSLDERLSLEAFEWLQEQTITALAILPLWSGTSQRGVILLASEVVCTFTARETQPYIALVRQIGVALENQRLLAETQAALAEVEAIQRRYTLQAWDNYRATESKHDYEYWHEEIGLKQPSLLGQKLQIPLRVRGETIGVLGLQDWTAERQWLPEEITLVEAIAEQAAQAAENLRLLNETQQKAALEAHVNTIGEKIRATQSLEEAMQVAIKEIGMSLKSPQTAVQLKVKS